MSTIHDPQSSIQDRANDNELLVRVSGVSKKFCRNLKKSLWYGMKDVASELLPFSSNKEPGTKNKEPGLRPGEFWANKDISFELRRGECLGLIGRNGAGKTTLLKMLNGLIKPDEGTIEMRGRVGALIALGAGFNPILTGRENVYVNGSILGLTREEIGAKIEDIIEFSEIRDFIDSPVQSYSSGMQVRLGFAVATALEPDVLILDEVLAVGDAAFRHKCYHRINKIIKNCAVILVSHSMDQIAAIATSIGTMHKGEFQFYDDIAEGITAYNIENSDSIASTADGGRVFVCYPPVESAEVKILNPEIIFGEALDVEVDFETTEQIDNLRLAFTAYNQSEQPVMSWTSTRFDRAISLPYGRSRLVLRIEPLYLHDGIYNWCFGLLRKGSIEHLVYAMRAGQFRVTSNYKPHGNVPYLPQATEFSITSL